jgi:CheY-like chemotaxis protein
MRAIRVLVADDNEEIRKRVSEVLDQEFEVVGTVPPHRPRPQRELLALTL